VFIFIVGETLPLAALPYGTREEYQNIKSELVNIQKEERIEDRILGCLYLDIKHMKELEEKISVGNRVVEAEYSELIMTAACASIMQM